MKIILLLPLLLLFLTGCTQEQSCHLDSECSFGQYCFGEDNIMSQGRCIEYPNYIETTANAEYEYNSRCNIMFMSNYTHLISVNNGPFTNYDGGICNGDEILVLYHNNTGYTNGIFKERVNIDTNVIEDKEFFLHIKPIDELIMTVEDDRNYIILDASNGLKVYPDQDVVVKIKISSMHNTTIPDMTCIIDHSDITKSEPNIMIHDYYGTVDIDNEYYRPISYAYKSGKSNIEVFDVVNSNKLNSILFRAYIGVRAAQSLGNTSLNIECYSKEYYLERDDKIYYMFEDHYGIVQSKNILKTEIFIEEQKRMDVLCQNNGVKVIGDSQAWENCTIIENVEDGKDIYKNDTYISVSYSVPEKGLSKTAHVFGPYAESTVDKMTVTDLHLKDVCYIEGTIYENCLIIFSIYNGENISNVSINKNEFLEYYEVPNDR